MMKIRNLVVALLVVATLFAGPVALSTAVDGSVIGVNVTLAGGCSDANGC